MAYSAKVGSFNIDTAKTAGQTQSVSGLGFQPKIVLFWWSGSTATEDAVAGGNASIGFGAMIDATHRFCVAGASDDAVADSSSYRRQRADEVIAIYTEATTPTLNGILDASTLDSDGFTLIVDSQFTSAYRISYMALGGDDLTNVYIGNKVTPATIGEFDTTDAGFQPDAVIFAGQFQASVSVAGSSMYFGLGTATGASNQGTVMGRSYDAYATMATAGYGYNGECLSRGETMRLTLVSMLSNGFTIDYIEGGSAFAFHYIALKGGQYQTGDIETRTDGNDIAETIGFSPKALLFTSANRALSTQDLSTAHSRISIGAATSSTNRAVQGISDENGLTEAEVAVANYDSAVYVNVQDDAAAGLMNLKSVESNGFTCVMTDPDPSACWVSYLAIGASGTEIKGNKSAYLSGQSTTLDNQSIYLEGSSTETPTNDSWSAYLVGCPAFEIEWIAIGVPKSPAQSASDNAPAYIGSIAHETSSKHAYLIGSAITSSSIHGFISGTSTQIDNSLAYTKGQSTELDNKPVYLNGLSITSSSKNAILSGTAESVNSVHSYLHGSISPTDNKSSYLSGQSLSSALSHAYTEGISYGVANTQAYLIGYSATTSSKSGFLSGNNTYIGNKPAYLGGQNESKDNQSVYTKGINSSLSSVHSYTIGQQYGYSNGPAYTQGKSNTLSSHSGCLWGQALTSNSKAAFTQGSELRSSQLAFLEGAPSGNFSTAPAYLTGYSDTASSKNAHLLGSNISTSNKASFLTGNAQSTDTQSAFTNGYNTSSSAKHSYLCGRSTGADSNKARIHGAEWPFHDDFNVTTSGDWNKWAPESKSYATLTEENGFGYIYGAPFNPASVLLRAQIDRTLDSSMGGIEIYLSLSSYGNTTSRYFRLSYGSNMFLLRFSQAGGDLTIYILDPITGSLVSAIIANPTSNQIFVRLYMNRKEGIFKLKAWKGADEPSTWNSIDDGFYPNIPFGVELYDTLVFGMPTRYTRLYFFYADFLEIGSHDAFLRGQSPASSSKPVCLIGPEAVTTNTSKHAYLNAYDIQDAVYYDVELTRTYDMEPELTTSFDNDIELTTNTENDIELTTTTDNEVELTTSTSEEFEL